MTGQNSNAGFDSFLDIVANLVGVMIILVVVVGANAASKWSAPKETPPSRIAEIESLQQEVNSSELAAKKLQFDNEELERQIRQEAAMAQQLVAQRHAMMLKVNQLEADQAVQLEKLDAKKKAAYTKTAEIASLRQQLVSVQRETQALKANQETPRETIEHFPTPIAKTVFSDEVHFRLSGGRLTYVPMEELIAQMKTEWKVKAEKLKQAPRTRETVGPVAGFRLQYELRAENVTERTQAGLIRGREIRFDRFVLVPTRDELGEPIKEALKPNSDFISKMGKFKPGKTTVSVWVYPDSFDAHTKLKQFLHDGGFQTASWPLSEGKLISGGPRGFHTSAQ